MKKIIDGFEYELKRDSKIIGIISADKLNYYVSLKPKENKNGIAKIIET